MRSKTWQSSAYFTRIADHCSFPWQTSSFLSLQISRGKLHLGFTKGKKFAYLGGVRPLPAAKTRYCLVPRGQYFQAVLYSWTSRMCLTLWMTMYPMYGFGYSTKWFESYLQNRSQRCLVNGFLCKNDSLICGIPQGTILGPLLFLICINDLPNCLEYSKPHMYADDNHMSFSSSNIDNRDLYLNQDIVNLSEWLIANKLTFNQSEREFIIN